MIFKYFFIKKFKWTDPTITSQFNGQPIEGRVYRGWVNNKTNHTNLVVDFEAGRTFLELFTLENKNEEYSWTGEIKELTKENILDFNIEEADLDNLIKWSASNNKDLLPKPAIVPTLTQEVDRVSDAYEEAMDVLGSIFATNGDLFDSILDTITHVYKYDMREMGMASALNYQEEGKGINCKEAIIAIEQYLSNTKRGDKVERIYEAVAALLKELQRRKLQDEGE